VTLWETVWEQLKKEMPKTETQHQRSWGGFVGAALMALFLVVIAFPIKLLSEIFKAVDLSQKPDHRAEALQLFREAQALALELPSKSEFARSVLDTQNLPPALQDAWHAALRSLYAENMPLETPAIPDDLESLDGVRWRDRMRRDIQRMKSNAVADMRKACRSAITGALQDLPHIAGQGAITADLKTLIVPGRAVQRMVAPLTSDLFPAFADRYEENVYRLSGVARVKHAKPPKLAEPHQFDDPSPFLEGTPFARLLNTVIPIEIPNAIRNEHHWIVAGSGAGKTNALQYFIGRDLERAMRGDCSIIVLDSQRQLIEKLAGLKLFAPGQPLDGKLCLLDAADIEFPIAINLFDMKLDRINTFTPLEREKLMNSALEMYDFVIGSLLQSEMTSRQSTLFRFVTRALFAIPNATIHTFHDLLQNGPARYQSAIDTLDGTTRQFFATDFASPQFKQTKEQVTARLWSVLGNQTFLRMFSSPRSKVDLFQEMNTPGKVILINAEKGLLKEDGTELFGRFFLALINQAAAQRSSLPPEQRLPCYVFIDECHNYIRNDQKIQVILAEARQQNVAVVLAHQFLAQIETPVLRALAGNTSIKMAARLEGADRSAMARDMNTVPDFIRDQRRGSFAVFIRGETPNAVSMHFPLAALSRFEAMSAAELETVLNRNRAQYANPLDGASQSERSTRDSSENSTQQNPSKNQGEKRDPDAE
jgi:Type IV secretion-system coupling protein DNA-binding domain